MSVVDNMIVWSLMDIFMAGAETTSTTLRWFFLYMISYPEVMKRIQAEIDEVVGKDRSAVWEDNMK
jgi:cytochrome P450